MCIRDRFQEGQPQDEEAEVVGAGQVPFELPADAESDVANKFRTVIDFMDVMYQTTDDEGNTIYIQSPLRSFPPGDPSIFIAMESLTVYEGPSVPGRINIRQAPRAVLAGIPGIGDNEELLQEIIDAREIDLDDPGFLDRGRKYETFLLDEGFVDFATMRALMLSLIHISEPTRPY